MRGRQREWNRRCLLTAWSTYIIASSFGGLSSLSFAVFLQKHPPPGYVPEKGDMPESRSVRRPTKR